MEKLTQKKNYEKICYSCMLKCQESKQHAKHPTISKSQQLPSVSSYNN